MPQSGFEDGFTVTTTGSLDTWVKEIHAKVPGAVEEYLYDQIKLVIKDFFQQTKAWRAWLGPFTIPANDGELCLNPVDAYSNVIQVLEVVRNGSSLAQVDIRQLPRLYATTTTTPNPSRFYLDPYHTIKLYPVPSLDVEDVYVTAALTPRMRADNRIPDWIVDQCYEAIKAGTLQRLYEEPDKIYSNVLKSEYWGKKYRAEKVRSRSVAAQGYGESAQPWGFPRWSR
jgi:hypothetical protein